MADDEATTPAARGAKPVTIYVLTDPRHGTVFYVGKTESPLQVRLRGHICDALAGRSSAGAIIREIVGAALRPTIRPIEIVNGGEWALAEKRWIAHYRSLGPLCNRTNGGQGVSGVLRTPDWIAKGVAARRESGRAAEGTKRAAQKNRGRQHTEQTKAKMSAVHKGTQAPATPRLKQSVPATEAGSSHQKRPSNSVMRGAGKRQSADHSEKKRLAMEPHQAKLSSDQIARWRDPEYRARITAGMRASHAARKTARSSD
jgi:hypothetical protein